MPWFKADDKLHGHPKIAELPLEAMGLWILAGTWCADYLTDGAITNAQIRRLGGTEELADQLIMADLWMWDGKHYWFKDWSEYQPTKESVESKREAESTAAARGNHTRWHAGRGVVSADCEYCSQSSGTRSGTRSDSDQVPVGSASGAGESAPNPPEPVPVPEPIKRDTHATDHGFDEWWQHYPKKIDKGQARKAFKAALKKTSLDTLTAGAKSYAAHCTQQGTEKRFIKNPSTWLNAEAWENETDTKAERPRTAWDYGPEAYMHPEEIEYERRATGSR